MSVVPSTSAVVLFVARDGGYFEREGLDVRITEFASGAEAERAMVAGAVDMGGGGVGTTLLMANQGIKAKNIVLFQKKPIFTLVVSNKIEPARRPQGAQGQDHRNQFPRQPDRLVPAHRIARRGHGPRPGRDAGGHRRARLRICPRFRRPSRCANDLGARHREHHPKEKAGAVFLDLRGDDVPPSLQNHAGQFAAGHGQVALRAGEPAKAKAAARAIAKAAARSTPIRT